MCDSQKERKKFQKEDRKARVKGKRQKVKGKSEDETTFNLMRFSAFLLPFTFFLLPFQNACLQLLELFTRLGVTISNCTFIPCPTCARNLGGSICPALLASV